MRHKRGVNQMLTIYKSTTEGQFKQVENIEKNSWLQLIAPTANEIDKVVKALAIPRDFITDSLDINERPRIEERDEATLIVIHIPFDCLDVVNPFDDVKYRTIPLGIIHAKDHLITICQEKVPFMQALFNKEVPQFATHMKTRNTLGILGETSRLYIDFLETIEKSIATAEAELAESYQNRELYALLYLNESLLYIATSLKQMKSVTEKIVQGNYIKLYNDDTEILDDALIELEQAHTVAEISQLNLNNIMDAYGNVIQNNVSHVVKFLTAIAIVLSLPTLVASVYGMNVPLPFQDEPYAFTVIIAIMIGISGIFSFVFHKKNYF